METTIKISSEVKSALEKFKIHERETYNDVIEIMMEDYLELNEKTQKEIGEARKRISQGEFHSQEEVEKMFGVK